MRLLSFISSALIAFNAASLIAGGIVGNNGDLVICNDLKNPGKQNYSLLDFYEARRTLKLSPTFGEVHEQTYDVTQTHFAELAPILPIVEFWLKGLERLDARNAQLIREYLVAFPSEWRLLEGQTLPENEDHSGVFLEDGCRIEQIAIQQTPRSKLHARYLLRADLWRQLADPVERAGLILHELVYRIALARGHTDSVYVRTLVPLIADQNNLLTMTIEEYQQHLVDLRFTGIFQPSINAGRTYVLYPDDLVDSYRAAQDLCRARHGAGSYTPAATPLPADGIIGEYRRTHDVKIWHAWKGTTPAPAPTLAAVLCEF